MATNTRDVGVDQFLDLEGVIFLWNCIKSYVTENTGSGGSGAPVRFYTMATGVDITTGDTINVPLSNYVGDTTNVAVGDTAIGIMKQTGSPDKLIFGAVSIINGGNTTVTKILMQEIPTTTTIDTRVVEKVEAFFNDYCSHFWAAFNNESAITVGSKHQIFKTNFVTPPGIGTYVTGIITINGNDHMYAVQGTTAADTKDPTRYVEVTLSVISPILSTAQVETMINAKLANVYKFQGSVAAYENLPTQGMIGGDVWNTRDTDMNYGWVEAKGEEAGHWDPLGQTFSINPIPNSVIQQIVDGVYGE